jgi:hypothetical protein
MSIDRFEQSERARSADTVSDMHLHFLRRALGFGALAFATAACMADPSPFDPRLTPDGGLGGGTGGGTGGGLGGGTGGGLGGGLGGGTGGGLGGGAGGGMGGDTDGGTGQPPEWWGEPITGAEKDAWTWVDVPGSTCANGEATGIAVNPSPAENPTGLFIYMEGGGACWTYGGCSLPIVLHKDGFDRDTWENGTIAAAHREIIPFQRTDENPWKDAHFVFVPYCTADVHGGSKTTELTGALGGKRTMAFHGYDNVTRYLERLVPTFHDTPRVWLTGSSAGGFGAELNWLQVQEHFGDVRVDVISDSGQPIMPKDGYWEAWLDTWDLQLPADCADCVQGIGETLDYTSERILARGARYGLVVYTRDAVISAFLGLSQDEHEARVLALKDQIDTGAFPNSDRVSYFSKSGSFHTTFLSGFANSSVTSEGYQVNEWVQVFMDDETLRVHE